MTIPILYNSIWFSFYYVLLCFYYYVVVSSFWKLFAFLYSWQMFHFNPSTINYGICLHMFLCKNGHRQGHFLVFLVDLAIYTSSRVGCNKIDKFSFVKLDQFYSVYKCIIVNLDSKKKSGFKNAFCVFYLLPYPTEIFVIWFIYVLSMNLIFVLPT